MCKSEDEIKKVDAADDASKEAAAPLATIGEVFSFVEDTQTKVYLALGFLFATIAGLALPASLFLFADVLGEVSAVAEQGLDPVIEVVYTMMVLGVISLVAETMVVGFMETAADAMTVNLKRKWFQAVVRQDMAYFDLQDVSGTATIISSNGAKFKKGVGKKTWTRSAVHRHCLCWIRSSFLCQLESYSCRTGDCPCHGWICCLGP